MRGDIDLPSFIFASDLKRTRQTADEFLKELLYEDARGIPPYGKPNDGPPPTQVYILPCSHELSYKSMEFVMENKEYLLLRILLLVHEPILNVSH